MVWDRTTDNAGTELVTVNASLRFDAEYTTCPECGAEVEAVRKQGTGLPYMVLTCKGCGKEGRGMALNVQYATIWE